MKFCQKKKINFEVHKICKKNPRVRALNGNYIHMTFIKKCISFLFQIILNEV